MSRELASWSFRDFTAYAYNTAQGATLVLMAGGSSLVVSFEDGWKIEVVDPLPPPPPPVKVIRRQSLREACRASR